MEGELAEAHKKAALVDAMNDPKAKATAQRAAYHEYDAMVEALKVVYNMPRILFPIHWESLTHTLKTIIWSKEDIDIVLSQGKHHHDGLKAIRADTFQHIAAYFLLNLFDKKIKEQWQNQLDGRDEPPTLDEIFTFLEKSSRKLAGSEGAAELLNTLKEHSTSVCISTSTVAEMHLDTSGTGLKELMLL